jgi:digeranylgeranylglycerophospholipid reductase
VIGGGPSGLHLARRLAAKGFDIEVLEEHLPAAEPVHCTGILSPDIFQEFSITPKEPAQELKTVQFHSPSGRTIQYRTEQVEAVVVDRYAFDRNLRDLAVAAGARINPGKRATKVEIRESHVAVHCHDDEPHNAKAFVLATGSSYMLHRDLGIGLPAVFLNCVQTELPVKNRGDVEIFFGRELAPKGFAWAVPVRRGDVDVARVGLMCEGNAETYFKKFLPRLKRLGIDIDRDLVLRPRMLPLAPVQKTYGPRFLVVGDAAGLVKPTTGGGVFYSMISAEISADVLADALHRDKLGESDLSMFQDLWRERLMEEIEAQLTLRLLLQRLTDDEVESIFDLWMTDGLMPLIRKTAKFNQHRKLIVALTRYPAMRKILFRKMLS